MLCFCRFYTVRAFILLFLQRNCITLSLGRSFNRNRIVMWFWISNNSSIEVLLLWIVIDWCTSCNLVCFESESYHFLVWLWWELKLHYISFQILRCFVLELDSNTKTITVISVFRFYKPAYISDLYLYLLFETVLSSDIRYPSVIQIYPIFLSLILLRRLLAQRNICVLLCNA